MRVEGVVFVYNPDKPGAQEAAQRGAAWCREHSIAPRIASRGQFRCREGDLVVAVGGDGTLLRTAAVLHPAQVPILGVHMGSLGFLASCTATHMEDALERVLEGAVFIERRCRLRARWPGGTGTALNDVALTGIRAGRFTQLEVSVNGTPVGTLAGDGVIVASATGATAYALACGGPLILPQHSAAVVVPVAPHHLGARPLVVPAEAHVRVRALFPANVMLDGDVVSELAQGAELETTADADPTLLVNLPEGPTYFQRLREKLGWLPGPAEKGDA